MDKENFIIVRFNSIYLANNPKGYCIELKNRYYSCFIITLKGKLRFSYDGGSVTADAEHPVFIPQGLSYKNECLEDASSLVFNFHTSDNYDEPIVLSPVSPRFATEKYDEIEKALLLSTPENKMNALSSLYLLASALFAHGEKLSVSDVTINKATEYICANYGLRTLSVSQVARECFVSEVYLRKLFTKKLNITPFAYIMGVRMNRARDLAREKLSVTEIANAVGYSDIYQFSRAYKKYFGYPPSET